MGLGFPADTFSVDDGSGLSRKNRVSARLLVAVVRDLYSQPELRTDFLCSLAVSGVDGTLARRLWGEETLGRVMAKTGTLSGVSSLSGVAFPLAAPRTGRWRTWVFGDDERHPQLPGSPSQERRGRKPGDRRPNCIP